MKTLNLGILAHVDAGKTTLTERLLYAAGAIDAAGSVDEGTTQTDSGALERARGITIRAAVAGFTVGDVAVNLIDTPGHPDFIAEVDRSLQVLDGAVLVVSAVEGVQAQTVVLMRALRRLRVPTLLFVNKVDRAGADPDAVVAAIRERLTRGAIPLGRTRDAGTRAASVVALDPADPPVRDALIEVLADQDDALLAAVAEGGWDAIPPGELRARLLAQTAAGHVHPLLFGSAATGAGVPALMTALTTLLPPAGGDPDGPASGSVFKVERGPRGERLAYVRMFAGSVRVRDRVRLGDARTATVTAIEVVEHGRTRRGDAVRAGQIARLSGLRDVRVGDAVGARTRPPAGAVFAPPTLETALAARDPAQATALRQALAQLAEQDPLIDVRQDDGRQELLVSLYGEVQKEVIEHALLADFGIPVEFRATTTICIERPLGAGSAVVRLGEPSNPFLATVGLALAPGPAGSGLAFELAVDLGTIPLYVYKTVGAFAAAMAEYVGDALRHGPSGWAVHDCAVTLTACGYSSPGTGAGDFRKLTPLVVRTALEEAGTVVCEPIQRFHLDAPADALPAVLGLLARCRAVPGAPVPAGRWLSLDGEVPAAEVPRLQRGLHGSTHGQGALEVRFDRYEPR